MNHLKFCFYIGLYYSELSTASSGTTGIYTDESEISKDYTQAPSSACAAQCYRYMCDEFTVWPQDGATNSICHLRFYNDTKKYTGF